MKHFRYFLALTAVSFLATPSGFADSWTIETPEEFSVYLSTSNIAMGGHAVTPNNGFERYIVRLRKGLFNNSPIGWEVDHNTGVNASAWSENASRQFAWEEGAWKIWLHPYEGEDPSIFIRDRQIEISDDAP